MFVEQVEIMSKIPLPTSLHRNREIIHREGIKGGVQG